MPRSWLALSLVLVACAGQTLIDTTPLLGHDEPKRPHAVTHHGGMLTTIEGAGGQQLELLPSGDLIVTGWAAHWFVMKLSADGKERWRVPFDHCGGLLLAVAGDAIYVVARADTLRWQFEDCDPQVSGEHGMVYKLDEHGRILWRVAAPLAPRWLVASTAGVIAGDQGAFAVTAAGHIAWTRVDPLTGTHSAAWASPGVLVLAGNGAYGPEVQASCFVRAIDAATGGTVWEHLIDPTHPPCIEPVVEIRGAHGVVRARAGSRLGLRATGFDAATGEPGWTNETPIEGPPFTTVPSVFGAPFAADSPLEMRYQLISADREAHIAVAIDLKSGVTRPIAALIAELKDHGINGGLLNVNDIRLDHGMLYAIGSFTGRLTAGPVHAHSPYEWKSSSYVVWRPMMFVLRIPMVSE